MTDLDFEATEPERPFRSRYDEYRKIETWGDRIWQLRVVFAQFFMMASMPVMIFVNLWLGLVWMMGSVWWVIHEINGYAKHWDDTSDD